MPNGQKCRDLHGNSSQKSLGREVFSEGALTGFRHYCSTLKDQPIKASNAQVYFTDCVDAHDYIPILKEMAAAAVVVTGGIKLTFL